MLVKLYRLVKCRLIHKQETKTAPCPVNVFSFEMGTFRGCSRCDIWRRVRDPDF
jgi:hypothetical protein